MDTAAPNPAPSPSPAPSLTVRSAEDLLALAPVLLGFTPTDSLVLLTFGGTSFQARVDLPPRGDDAAVAAVVEVVLGPVRRHRVGQAAVLLYTDDARLARVVARDLSAGLRTSGAHVVDCLRAHDGRWWPALGSREGVPAWGVAYDVDSHPFSAQSVLEGRVTLPSRESLASLLDPPPGPVAAVRDAAVALEPRPPHTHLEWWGREQVWAAGLVRHHLERRSVPSTDEIARLVVGMSHLGVRDAAWEVLPETPGEQARAAADLWVEVVRRCPRRWRAPAAALLAYAAWSSGNGALAWCAVDVATEADPTHTLTGLVAQLLSAAVRPGSLGLRGGSSQAPVRP